MNLYRDVSVDCFPVLQDIYVRAAFIIFLDRIVTLRKEILYIRTYRLHLCTYVAFKHFWTGFCVHDEWNLFDVQLWPIFYLYNVSGERSVLKKKKKSNKNKEKKKSKENVLTLICWKFCQPAFFSICVSIKNGWWI